MRHRVSSRAVSIVASILAIMAVVPVDRLYAHDFWIEPMNFHPEPGDEVSLLLRVGQDLSGDRLPYIDDWFSDYRVVAPSGSRPVTGLMGDDPAGSFEVSEPGVHLIGYRSTRDFVELESGKFHSYLEDEGLERVIAMRAARGEADRSAREYYSRCAKSLIDAGADGPGEVFSAILGYTLELIPTENPYARSAGDSLPLRLLYRGEPIEGVLVQGFTAAAPEHKVSARTDARGQATLRLDRPGLWLVKAVHMIEAPPDVDGADWESFWASLTFNLPDRN